MIQDDTKLLLTHVMETYGEILDQVNYVQTFRVLKLKYEQSQERFKERAAIESVPALLRSNRFRRDPRQLDEDEEMWFNDEDEVEDGEPVVSGTRSPPEILNRKIDDELDSIGRFQLSQMNKSLDINLNVDLLGKLLDKKSGDSTRSPNPVTSLSNRSPSLNSTPSIVSSGSPLGTSNATTEKLPIPAKVMES